MKHGGDACLMRRDAVTAREAFGSPRNSEHVAIALPGEIRPDLLGEVKEVAGI
jgi:hypothetical protein